VVEVSGATVAENSRLVSTPIGGINTNGDGAGSNGRLEGTSVTCSNHGPWFAGVQDLLTSGRLASTFDSFVGIRTLRYDTSAVDVVKSPFGPGTIASLALETFLAAAINQLLFREAWKCSFLQLVSRLKQAGGGEGPA